MIIKNPLLWEQELAKLYHGQQEELLRLTWIDKINGLTGDEFYEDKKAELSIVKLKVSMIADLLEQVDSRAYTDEQCRRLVDMVEALIDAIQRAKGFVDGNMGTVIPNMFYGFIVSCLFDAFIKDGPERVIVQLDDFGGTKIDVMPLLKLLQELLRKLRELQGQPYPVLYATYQEYTQKLRRMANPPRV